MTGEGFKRKYKCILRYESFESEGKVGIEEPGAGTSSVKLVLESGPSQRGSGRCSFNITCRAAAAAWEG